MVGAISDLRRVTPDPSLRLSTFVIAVQLLFRRARVGLVDSERGHNAVLGASVFKLSPSTLIWRAVMPPTKPEGLNLPLHGRNSWHACGHAHRDQPLSGRSRCGARLEIYDIWRTRRPAREPVQHQGATHVEHRRLGSDQRCHEKPATDEAWRRRASRCR